MPFPHKQTKKGLKMSKQGNVLTLDVNEQDCWLNRHLPNRVGAAWPWLPGLSGEWEWKGDQWDDFDKNADRNHVWCIGRAVDHGRKAAMRWLIEFVGISFDHNTKEPISPPRRLATDVWIQCFVAKGSGLDLQVTLDPANPSPKARILAGVWKGCTQSSMHSTFRTNHPDEDPPALAKAFPIIVEHLQAKLYEPKGKRVREIVRVQQ